MKKIIKWLVLIIISITFCGCWGYNDIKNLNILNGMGIDLNEENDFFVIYEIINTNKSKDSHYSEEDRSYYSSVGKSIFEAGRKLTTFASGKRLYYQTCEVAILGQKLCETGITPMIDFFTRDPKRRTTIYPIVVEGNMENFFSNDVKVTETMSSALVNIIKLYEYTGYAVNKNLSKTNIDSQSITGTALINKFKLYPKKNMESAYEPVLNGVGVFYKNKLVGSLNLEETMVSNILTKKVKNSIMVINNKESKESGRNISIEFSKFKTKLTPIIDNDNYVMNISIDVNGAIVQYSEKEMLATYNYDELKKLSSQYLVNLINETFVKCKNDIKADALNFGNVFSNKYKDISEMNSDDWTNIFCNKLTIKTNVKVNFTTTGTTLEKSD